MRAGWGRGHAPLAPTGGEIGQIASALLPQVTMTAAEPVGGGLANTNLRLLLRPAAGNPGAPTVALLRFWQRDPAAAAREVALLRRLAGRLPVPGVLAFLPADPVFGVPCALLQWIDGERLDRVLAARPEAAGVLGHAAGRALAAVHGETFARQGFSMRPFRSRRSALAARLGWMPGCGPVCAATPGRDGSIPRWRRRCSPWWRVTRTCWTIHGWPVPA